MKVAVDFFSKAVGARANRTRRLDWEALGYSPHNLEDLDMPFTENELLHIINELPAEKGLDRMVILVCSIKSVGT
jgi:hypothetical protein